MDPTTTEIMLFVIAFLLLAISIWWKTREKVHPDFSSLPDLSIAKGAYARAILYEDIGKDLEEGVYDLRAAFVVRLKEPAEPGTMFGAIEYMDAYIRYEGVKVLAALEPGQYLCVAVRKTLPKGTPLPFAN